MGASFVVKFIYILYQNLTSKEGPATKVSARSFRKTTKANQKEIVPRACDNADLYETLQHRSFG
jgi:hypothetical protein